MRGGSTATAAVLPLSSSNCRGRHRHVAACSCVLCCAVTLPLCTVLAARRPCRAHWTQVARRRLTARCTQCAVYSTLSWDATRMCCALTANSPSANEPRRRLGSVQRTNAAHGPVATGMSCAIRALPAAAVSSPVGASCCEGGVLVQERGADLAWRWRPGAAPLSLPSR